MEAKLAVALLIVCCCLQAHQSKPLLKEIEMPPRKLLQQAAATGPADNGASETRPRSLGDSIASRLVLIAVPSLCVIVVGILCRLRGQNPQTQNVEPAEALRPSITFNIIGSCFSLNYE